MSPFAVEMLGYAASTLIVLSLAMTSVVRLRIISLIGSICYVVYGLLIGSFPVALSNFIIVLLNLWNLYTFTRRPSTLDAVRMDVDSPFLEDFLASHMADIRASQPEFAAREGDTAFVLMRDGMPAGALAGRQDGETFELTLDYVLPAYRDTRMGTWLFVDKPSVLRKHGIRRIVARPTTPVHTSYLTKVGFAPAAAGTAGVLERDLG